MKTRFTLSYFVSMKYEKRNLIRFRLIIDLISLSQTRSDAASAADLKSVIFWGEIYECHLAVRLCIEYF